MRCDYSGFYSSSVGSVKEFVLYVINGPWGEGGILSWNNEPEKFKLESN